MMTEDEARTKWCPQSRVMDWEEFRDGEKPATVNRFPHSPEDLRHKQTRCVASDCMMWRDELTMGGLKGWCGLAGEPKP